MSRFQASTVYFCGNCEDELVGLPSGSRVHSGRPLCGRCTEIGVAEGWGASNPTVRIHDGSSKHGITLLLFMLAVVGGALFFAMFFTNRNRF